MKVHDKPVTLLMGAAKIARLNQLGVNACVTKPNKFRALADVTQTLFMPGFETVRLSPHEMTGGGT